MTLRDLYRCWDIKCQASCVWSTLLKLSNAKNCNEAILPELRLLSFIPSLANIFFYKTYLVALLSTGHILTLLPMWLLTQISISTSVALASFSNISSCSSLTLSQHLSDIDLMESEDEDVKVVMLLSPLSPEILLPRPLPIFILFRIEGLQPRTSQDFDELPIGETFFIVLYCLTFKYPFLPKSVPW